MKRPMRWMVAKDGDGLVCPHCETDFCTLFYDTDKFLFCPHCGERVMRPRGGKPQLVDASDLETALWDNLSSGLSLEKAFAAALYECGWRDVKVATRGESK